LKAQLHRLLLCVVFGGKARRKRRLN